MIETGIIVDFKFRSKFFNSYTETMKGCELDFSDRVEIFYAEETELEVDELIITNPAYVNSPISSQSDWDETCCSSTYYVNRKLPTSWLMKYEVYFADDSIEISKNGEFERFAQISEDGDKFPTRLH